MSACSRCGHRDPNPGCYVCAEDEPDTYPNDEDVTNDVAIDRLLDQTDYLRDCLRDLQMEEAREDKSGRFGNWADDDCGPDMDDFIKEGTSTP